MELTGRLRAVRSAACRRPVERRWIEENYTEEITIAMLAERCAMGQRTFERRFKQSTGDSPIAYLQKVRINAAKALLERPHSTFEEATYHVGYEDISSFRKIFQRHTGLRPKEYQRLFQQRNQIQQAG